MVDQQSQAIAALEREVDQLKSLTLGLACLVASLPDSEDVDMDCVRGFVRQLSLGSAHPSFKGVEIPPAMWIAQEIRRVAVARE